MPAELTDAPSRGAMIYTHVRHSRDSRQADLDAPHMDEATAAQTLAATKRQAVPGALMRWVMSTSASRSYQALEDTCASLRTSGTLYLSHEQGWAWVLDTVCLQASELVLLQCTHPLPGTASTLVRFQGSRCKTARKLGKDIDGAAAASSPPRCPEQSA